MIERRLPEPARPPGGPLDPTALAALYDRHGSLAYGLALRLTGDPARSEDVVCDAFLRLARSPGLTPDVETGRRQIVAFVAAAAIRARPATPGPVPDPATRPRTASQTRAQARSR